MVGLTEVNKDWRQVSTENTVWAATASWTETRRIQTSTNTTCPSQSEHQIGGTISMCFNELAHRVSGRGQDSRNLGRWSWIELNGVGECSTTIITAYCPVISPSPGSCYSQHLTYMSIHANKADTDHHYYPPEISCPRQLFGSDLKRFVDQKRLEGHQVILMGDFNSEYDAVRDWMLDLGLLDVIGRKHGTQNVPRTHTRSKDSPIDCIFATAEISCALGGFLAFGKLLGDHRGLWIDVPKVLLLGCKIPPLLHPTARRLQLNDPRIVNRYLSILHDAMEENNVYGRMDMLHSRTIYPLPNHLAVEYEALDAEICEYMDLAEKKCRKLRMGAVKYSPTYKCAVKIIEYWNRRRDHELGTSRNVRKLIGLQNKYNIEYEENLSLSEIDKRLSEAILERRRCKEVDDSLQLEYRHCLANAKEAEGNIKAAVHLRNMNRIEAQRTCHRNIRYMEGKISAGATSQLTIKLPNGSTRELTSKAEVEQAIITCNEKKYHQTEGGSQLIMPDLVNDLGHCGDGHRVNDVLNGTYEPPEGTSDATRDFLQACQRPETVQEIPLLPTPLRYWNVVRSWKTRKESTTSAHQHIGHYKAAMRHPQLSWLLFQRSEIPTISGYSPRRHRNCIDLMIMKKAMSFAVEKQRTLGILDSEFNHCNKALQYEAMHAALEHDAIAVEQYSRPNRSCAAHALNRRLMADDRQSRRLAWALAMSDLTSCYDRIVHNAAALALLRIGVPHAKIISMFKSIQRMIHRVRTVFGDSEKVYGGDDWENWLFAPQGFIQGNAAGPAIWSILSSIIFGILRDQGHSDAFCSAISKQLFLLVGFAYVDDCDLIQSGTDPLEVGQSMQAVIRQWGDLMEVTGGALNLDPSKSYWYLVEYVWKRGKWVARDADLGGFDLVARTADNEWVSMTRLSGDQESEMLGLFMSPSGNKTRMLEKLRTLAIEWGAKVRSGRSSQEETWVALKTTISRKLAYPLPALTLTEAECISIMAPALRAALPKSGISSSISSVVRHAPTETLGLNVLHLYVEMGSARTTFLVHHCWQKTPTGILLQNAIENQVLEMGLYGSIWLNSRFPNYSKWCSDHSWLFNVCSFNNEHEINLTIPHAELKPRRINDNSLMHLASEFWQSKGELRSFNRVRMLHGVVSLSDITAANGRCLDQIFLTNSKFEGQRNSFGWPVKHQVSPHDFTVWRRTLEHIFQGEQLQLQTPLGNWIMNSDEEWLDNWEWFTTEDGEFLYFKDAPHRWHRFLRRPRSYRTFYAEFLIEHAAPAQRLRRATVEGDVDSLFLLSSSDRYDTEETPAELIRVGNHHLPAPLIKWVCEHFSASDDLEQLILDLRAGRAIAVGDGSYFDTKDVAAAAWIISSADGSSWIQGGGRVHGPNTDLNSYRGELGSLLGIAVGVKCLSDSFGGGAFTLINACDNLEAVKKLNVRRSSIQPSWKSVDLITQILDVWEMHDGLPIATHVYGHQDDKRIGPLSFIEHLNVKMDTLAKRIAISHFHTVPRPLVSYPLGIGTITVGGHPIVSTVQKAIVDHIHHTDMVAYLERKWSLDENLLRDTVHWRCLGKARKSSSFPIQKFISKWISGDTATGEVMVYRKQRDSSACPHCQQENEDLVHVLSCTNQLVREKTQALLEELREWMVKEDTHPHLLTAIMHNLTLWFQDPFDDEPVDFNVEGSLLRALRSQDIIGWYAFLMGCISSEIIRYQQVYYSALLSKKKGASWGKRLILQCWAIVHKLWLNRNSVLHNTEAIDMISGSDKLRIAIIAEHTIGRSSLNPVFTKYFRINIHTLLTKPLQYRKQWFRVVRAAREAARPQLSDEFTDNPALRRWIGLPPPRRH